MSFIRQLGTLVWKNLLFTIIRHPIGFLFKFYALPLIIFSALVRLPAWVNPTHFFDAQQPAAIASLSDSLIGGRLAIIQPPKPGPDMQAVIDRLTAPIDSQSLLFLDGEDALQQHCSSGPAATGGCHASVTFLDSPETKAVANATWRYVIRSDAGMAGAHDGGLEKVYMPLQLAINNAITNSSAVPEVFAFGPSTDANRNEVKQVTLDVVSSIYAFIVFACHLFTVYQLVSWVTADRDTGASALIDSMGGRWASVARTLSWVIALDLVCMPLFIIFGILYWQLLFPTSSAGVLIGWQILLGMALNSASVFAASFFTKARVSSILVSIAFMVLAVTGQFYTTRPSPQPNPSGVMGLSLLFPSCTFTLYMFDMAKWEKAGKSAIISSFPPRDSPSDIPDLYVVTQSVLLAALVVQTIAYLGLAMLTEWAHHGISFRGRHFSRGPAEMNKAAVSTANLKKRFSPGFWATLCCFCCGRRRGNLAVSDVSLEAHRGQIMCLVGQNGSGKTTTLQMIGGFLSLDAGRIFFDAAPSQIGICPQNNVLWEELTVREHVVLWSGIKSGCETPEQIDQVIADCDLAHKSSCLAKNLSGGQKRKLQLACMFIGGSSICLIDECTSGLDPLSRQAIWDLLLRNRTNRSMIFTTHFLDEVDVLADHIVVLHQGKVKCQGSPAELNSTYGGGYKVIVERTPRSLAVNVTQQATMWQDRLVFEVANSVAATKLSNTFSAVGVQDVAIAGPQFEDVFLNLAVEDGDSTLLKPPSLTDSGSELTRGRETSFAAQVRILLGKRFKVLPRVWWPYFLLVAVVIAADVGFLSTSGEFRVRSCDFYTLGRPQEASTPEFFYEASCQATSDCDQLTVAPPSANSTLFDAVRNGYQDFDSIKQNLFSGFVNPLTDKKTWLEYLQSQTRTGASGVYFGSGKDDPSIIAYRYSNSGSQALGTKLLNIWSQVNAKVEIDAQYGALPAISKETELGAWVYIVFYTLVQAAYPAFFVVYPAIERMTAAHSLQYANGVRRTPHMVAYTLFDFFWILIVSVISALSLFPIKGWIGTPWIMIPVFGLHAMCGNFISQIVGHVSNGPLKSFMAALGVNLLFYAVGVGSFMGTSSSESSVISGITWGLGLFLPVGNLVRALMLGLNAGGLGCTNGVAKSVGSLNSFGGPLLYLGIQIVMLATLSVWFDGGLPYIPILSSLFKHKPAVPLSLTGTEMENLSRGGQDDVQVEAMRATRNDSDPLRVLHVTKQFGTNVAVNDVTFGLSSGEVLALLGPNGAGKSTLVNMIQSEFPSTRGEIRLCGQDSRSLSARKHLGVCPQHDALDLLTTRQHLMLYARIKGVADAKANVTHLLDRLGLTPHAKTMAAKLSGGNKRKLSLAIALMGAPPVLVLDEPTTAMDAMAKRSFWRIIESIASDHSVLLTTHSMEEADRLAARTAIMASRMLAIGSTAQLRSKYGGGYSVSLTLRSAPDSTREEMEDVLAWVRRCAPGPVKLERAMLRGQIRLMLAQSGPAGTSSSGDGSGKQPAAIAMWNLLEENKQALGVAFYSIGGATLANAFMNVVRANDVREENSEAKKMTFGQKIRDLL